MTAITSPQPVDDFDIETAKQLNQISAEAARITFEFIIHDAGRVRKEDRRKVSVITRLMSIRATDRKVTPEDVASARDLVSAPLD